MHMNKAVAFLKRYYAQIVPIAVLIVIVAGIAIALFHDSHFFRPPPQMVANIRTTVLGQQQSAVVLEGMSRRAQRGIKQFSLMLSWSGENQESLVCSIRASQKKDAEPSPKTTEPEAKDKSAEEKPKAKSDEEKSKTKSAESKKAEKPDRYAPTPCTLESLAQWMVQMPDAVLMLSVAGNTRPVAAFTKIKDHFPDALHRVIPQVPDPRQVETIRKLGYKNVAMVVVLPDPKDKSAPAPAAPATKKDKTPPASPKGKSPAPTKGNKPPPPTSPGEIHKMFRRAAMAGATSLVLPKKVAFAAAFPKTRKNWPDMKVYVTQVNKCDEWNNLSKRPVDALISDVIVPGSCR